MDWNLFGLFKRAPDPKPSDTPAAPNTMNASTQRPTVSYENAITAEAAMTHPFVFFCLTTVAKALATVEWYAEADPLSSTPAGKRAVDQMNALLQSPNLNYSPYQLRFWMALNYACFGRIPFKVGLSVENFPNGIYPLAVAHTKENLDPRGLIAGYTYGTGDSAEVLPVRSKARAGQSYAHEVATPTISGQVDFTNNVTALRAVGLPSQIMRMLMQRAADTASGHPNMKYVISSEKNITEPQKQALRDHIENAGPSTENSGNILFIGGVAIKIDELDNDLSDIHSKMPTDDMARMILRDFGIPVALAGLGAADGAKFANNYDGSRASFYEDTIIPGYCSPIATGMTAGLCPPGMLIKFDIDGIPAIGAARAARAKDIDQLGFLTIDERRELAGYKPIGGTKGAQLGPLPKIATPAPVATTPENGA